MVTSSGTPVLKAMRTESMSCRFEPLPKCPLAPYVPPGWHFPFAAARQMPICPLDELRLSLATCDRAGSAQLGVVMP